MKQGGIFGFLELPNYCISVAMNIYSHGGEQGLWEVVVFPDKKTRKPMKLKCFNDNTFVGNLDFVKLQGYLVKIQQELK